MPAHRQAMFVRKRRKYEKVLLMPLFLCYSHHWTLQRKLRDGEEREHKSEREEEGEEADGIEDEFGVSFAAVALVNDWINIVLMSGGQRWRRLKFRRTPLKRCLPSLFSTRMGSSLTWRPRSIKIETRELYLRKLNSVYILQACCTEFNRQRVAF